MILKHLTLAGLLACALPAFAQSPTTQMPEGTKDIELSLIAALVPVREGKDTVRLIVLPSASVLWSNGVFLSPGEVGMQLSEDPSLRYGPLLSYGIKSRRADDADDKSRLGIEAGAFMRYRLAHNMGLYSSLMYGGGDNNDGVRFNLGASFTQQLSTHQSLSLSVGANLADSNYMQSYFGVNSAQAVRGQRREYSAGAGIKNSYVSLNWNVQLSNKFALSTGASMSRLGDKAANSPLVEKRSSTFIWTSLSYHY
jgi:outer membrane protein